MGKNEQKIRKQKANMKLKKKKAKSWLFERTNKTNKPLERLIKKKRQSTNHQYQGFLKTETTHLADNFYVGSCLKLKFRAIRETSIEVKNTSSILGSWVSCTEARRPPPAKQGNSW